jgi:hypothetical protein
VLLAVVTLTGAVATALAITAVAIIRPLAAFAMALIATVIRIAPMATFVATLITATTMTATVR